MRTINISTNLEFLSGLNVQSFSNHKIHETILGILQRLGEFEEVDDVSIIHVKHDMTSWISHAWHRNCLSNQRVRFPGVFFLHDCELKAQLNNENLIYIQNCDMLKNEALKHCLERANMRSVLLLPLFTFTRSFAFLCLSKTRTSKLWEQEDICFLNRVAEILAEALNKEVASKIPGKSFLSSRGDSLLPACS